MFYVHVYLLLDEYRFMPCDFGSSNAPKKASMAFHESYRDKYNFWSDSEAGHKLEWNWALDLCLEWFSVAMHTFFCVWYWTTHLLAQLEKLDFHCRCECLTYAICIWMWCANDIIKWRILMRVWYVSLACVFETMQIELNQFCKIQMSHKAIKSLRGISKCTL